MKDSWWNDTSDAFVHPTARFVDRPEAADEDRVFKVERVALTEQQRAGLTVTRDVHIPGASTSPGWKVVEWLGPRAGLHYAVRRDVFAGVEYLKGRDGKRREFSNRDAAASARDAANARGLK